MAKIPWETQEQKQQKAEQVKNQPGTKTKLASDVQQARTLEELKAAILAYLNPD